MMISSKYRGLARLVRGICRAWVFVLLQMAAPAVFAHAALIETLPVDGAMLGKAPAEVRLRFNEPVAPLVFKLLLPDGSTQAVTHIAAEQNGLKASLPDLPAPGTYLLSWRVVSADGHPVGGSITYSVGVRSDNGAAVVLSSSSSSSPSSSSSSSSPLPLLAAIWLIRFGLYMALFIGVGAALFRAFIAVETASPAWWATAALLKGLVLAPLAVGMQGLDALALPWDALGSLQPWRAGLDTAYGVTAWLMLASLLAACAANAVDRRWLSRPAAIVSTLLLGAALAASGHAGSAPPQWLARPAVFIHGVAIAAWVGSLLPLLMLLRGEQGMASLSRFSRVIPWVLALLLISGATLALLQLDSVQSLWTTDYGRILSAKLILLLLLLGVATFNRYALTARVQRGDARARLWMRRSICVELLLVAMILALVAIWRFTPPPRAMAAAASAAAPVSVHLHATQAMVDLTLTPQHDRRVRASLFVQGGDFSPLDAQEVSLQFSNPARGIEPLLKSAHRGADGGTWLVEPFALPASGRWHVRIDVLISDFVRVELEKDIDVAF